MSDDVEEQEQETLFEIDPDWKDLWRGMMPYDHKDLQPDSTLLVHFKDKRARAAFADLLKQTLNARTKFVWFPKAEIGTAADKVFTGEKVTPRYPIYIISKGRADSRLTSKAFEWAQVPYHIVVEPQEFDAYAAVIDTKKILVTPFSNLGQGGIPARNFVWEHAISTGALRHWIFDDNISGFCRFQDNLKVEVDNGALHCAIEDWADRYENVAMCAFNYDYFAPRKQGAKIKPITLNTRCYSGILLRNDLTIDGEPVRWRGRYNEDTDLSLRLLKAGHCTALFNAFLMYKKPTLTMKGGNATELYTGAGAVEEDWRTHAASCEICKQCVDGYAKVTPCEVGCAILSKDGRWLMAESLREQHPDCTTVERKWGSGQEGVARWQHQVDYRAFRPELGLNVLKLKEGIVIPAESAYDLTLEAMPGEGDIAVSVQGAPLLAAAIADIVVDAPRQIASALDFVRGKKINEQIPFDPAFFRDYLAKKGHRLLTRDGKFFVSESSSLTESERATIKQHRELLIPFAEQIDVDVVVASRSAAQAAADGTSTSNPTDVGVTTSNPIDVGVTTSNQVDVKVTTSTVLTAESAGDVTAAVAISAAAVAGPQDVPAGTPPSDSPFNQLEQDAPLGIVGARTPDFFDESKQTQTLAQFLGSAPPRVDVNFTPDEIPDLTNVNELVLNFATDGLDWANGARAVGVTVSTLDGQLTRFLPFAFKGGGNLPKEQVIAFLRDLKGKKITNAKTKFDLHIGHNDGIDFEGQGCTFSDIQHTAALLDDHRKRFALDILCADYFPSEPFVVRVDESRHSEYHASEVAEREKFTAQLVGRLRAKMYPELEVQDLTAVQKLEDEVIPAVVEMERNGSPIDMELLARYGQECNEKHDALMWEISKECGFAFEHTAKGWQRLIESLHLDVPDSFSEGVLNEVEHPLVRKGQRASQYASLNSKIFKAYPEHIVDGILRYNINQLVSDDGGTVSGRFSIGIVQQVPNEYNHSAIFGDELFPRRLFIPGSGKYLEGDAAQIEFRLLVHYSENVKLLQAYRDDPWMSFHKKMQEMLVAYKPDMNYAHTKSYNFAAQYGARSIKLAVMMGFINARSGEEIRKAKRWDDPRLKTIKEIETAYRKAHPEAGMLLDRASHLMKNECDQYCKRGDALHRQYPHRGYIKTFSGRRSRCINNYKPYIALNRCLQGTGASVMKRKLTELHAVRKETGFVMRITNHDAVLGDATTPETLGKVSAILNGQSFSFKVPILWQCGTGRNWAEAK